MLRTINIIEKYKGSINNIISYSFAEDYQEKEVVLVAENKFRDILKEVKNLTDQETEPYIEDGYYEDGETWELLLTWSDEVHVFIPLFTE